MIHLHPGQKDIKGKLHWKKSSSANYKTYGTIKGGGYIWHTADSGKTLTSFKTVQLASQPYIYNFVGEIPEITA